MTFEQLVQSARARQSAGFDPVPVIVDALERLAGERGAPPPPTSPDDFWRARVAGAFGMSPEMLRQPRSYSHWGMFA